MGFIKNGVYYQSSTIMPSLRDLTDLTRKDDMIVGENGTLKRVEKNPTTGDMPGRNVIFLPHNTKSRRDERIVEIYMMY